MYTRKETEVTAIALELFYSILTGKVTELYRLVEKYNLPYGVKFLLALEDLAEKIQSKEGLETPEDALVAYHLFHSIRLDLALD